MSPAAPDLSHRTLAIAGIAITGAAIIAACILPDTIQTTESGRDNRHPVRIVDAMTLSAQADLACVDLDYSDGCPQPGRSPETVLPKFLDPSNADYQYCSCPEGLVHREAQPAFSVYLEDRDGAESADYDTLYAALVLDYDPTRPATDKIRYRAFIDPDAEVPAPLPLPADDLPIGRPDPVLRRLQLGSGTTKFDFCNLSGGSPLSEGYHTLTLIVTDRPWFTEVIEYDSEGPDQTVDTAGTQEITHEGVPDLAGGASFDTATYLFYCYDHAKASDAGISCTCADPNEPDE